MVWRGGLFLLTVSIPIESQGCSLERSLLSCQSMSTHVVCPWDGLAIAVLFLAGDCVLEAVADAAVCPFPMLYVFVVTKACNSKSMVMKPRLELVWGSLWPGSKPLPLLAWVWRVQEPPAFLSSASPYWAHFGNKLIKLVKLLHDFL